MSERAVVAMSGGVDSSVAAALMVERGYEAVGVTMSLAGGALALLLAWPTPTTRGAWPSASASASTWRTTPSAFDSEVKRGLRRRLPRRAARRFRACTCNTKFKFELSARARAASSARRAVASGHYARIDDGPGDGPAAPAHAPPTRRRIRPTSSSSSARSSSPPSCFPARRPDEARGARARAPAGARHRARSPRARRSASFPTATTRAPSSASARSALPGEGEIVDARGASAGAPAGHPPLHRRAAARPRRSALRRPLYVTPIDAETQSGGGGRRRRAAGPRRAARGRVWIAGAAAARRRRAPR